MSSLNPRYRTLAPSFTRLCGMYAPTNEWYSEYRRPKYMTQAIVKKGMRWSRNSLIRATALVDEYLIEHMSYNWTYTGDMSRLARAIEKLQIILREEFELDRYIPDSEWLRDALPRWITYRTCRLLAAKTRGLALMVFKARSWQFKESQPLSEYRLIFFRDPCIRRRSRTPELKSLVPLYAIQIRFLLSLADSKKQFESTEEIMDTEFDWGLLKRTLQAGGYLTPREEIYYEYDLNDLNMQPNTGIDMKGLHNDDNECLVVHEEETLKCAIATLATRDDGTIPLFIRPAILNRETALRLLMTPHFCPEGAPELFIKQKETQ
ncbi:hypothetical protein NA57DRAFT_61919 [Rhizodiscina lignyota]|uniref:Uncharacterized protein n=1 Tax=Rhizodiscina lignyota TaxID=1504668 RepID=A0A9P4I403_9PEZI|nr:hypothetical protein NA57DRAFT_61919 [Rhizodiscina lignyota]